MDDNLLRRFTLIKNIEYFIEESVYCRSHSDSFSGLLKEILLKNNYQEGKVNIYENNN